MVRFYFRLLILMGLVVSAGTTAVVFITRRIDPGAVLVYAQFRRGEGRYLQYHDPFRQISLRKRQTAHMMEQSYQEGTFAPDGQSYIIPRPTANGVDLFLVGADRSIRQQLTHFEDFPLLEHRYNRMRSNTYPVWSPDGHWVAFISSDLMGYMDIFIIRPDGSDLSLVRHDVGTPVPLVLRWVVIDSKDISAGSALLIQIGLLGAGFVLLYRLKQAERRA